MRIGSSDRSLYDANCFVEDNLFQECNGEIEIISNKSCGNLYRRNTFRACDGTLTLRHGNRCSVYQNFFLGDKVNGSGGVRVIGEDHRVYNNYFENLQGDEYRSAICLVNGVPDSPLNRYFPVKGALIAHNTIVNCKRSFVIGAGANDEQSLAPRDCVIADNLVYSDHRSHILVEYHAPPNNLIYQGNIMYGAALGIDLPNGGILWQDPGLMPTDSLWRPVTDFPRPGMTSPLLDAAQSHLDFITADLDGQTRTGLFDVGADENSDEPITIHPLTPDDVGPTDNRPRRRPSR
jgi:poly(beta-D-mannuronate) lyase